jgi:uncharacterized protein
MVANMVTTQWRTVCRQRMAQQAEQEARAAWQIGPDAPIPFNHRWEHVQEVVQLALWLAETLDADREIVEAAAWLHDIGKVESNHGVAGAEEAERILITTDFPPAKIAAVAQVIRLHVGMYRAEDAVPLEPVEAAILWDADKLSKLGVHALAFMLSAIYLVGQTLAERRQSSAEFVYDVLSRTVASMNTAPARRLAQQRYADMVNTLDIWAREEQEAVYL